MPPPSIAAAEADPNEMALRALEAIGAQREMPSVSVSHGFSVFRWLFARGSAIGDAVFVGLLVLCLGLILVAVLRARGRQRAAWQESVAVAASPTGSASPHLERAEVFARDGRYGEAMHELLLQALADIRGQAGNSLGPSLTSREILQQARLGDLPRAALRMLIGRVEYTYFGLRSAEGSDYQASRADLDRLRQALLPA
jgi:hypothetical protein